MSVCIDCQTVLTVENWAPSRQSKKHYLCKSCATNRLHKRYANDPAYHADRKEYYKKLSKEKLIDPNEWERRQEYRLANADKMKAYLKDYHLANRYGISAEVYAHLLEQQNNKCAICLTETPGGQGRFHIDHCHKSNKIRGLLCQQCNMALGMFKDDVTRLKSAIRYLEEK